MERKIPFLVDMCGDWRGESIIAPRNDFGNELVTNAFIASGTDEVSLFWAGFLTPNIRLFGFKLKLIGCCHYSTVLDVKKFRFTAGFH